MAWLLDALEIDRLRRRQRCEDDNWRDYVEAKAFFPQERVGVTVRRLVKAKTIRLQA